MKNANIIKIKNKRNYLINVDHISFKELDGFQYFKSYHISRLRSSFLKFFKSKKIDLSVSNSVKIRSLFFEFFQTKDFKKDYLKLGLEIQSHFKIPKKFFVLQQNPTPRVFKPGDHGTSLHSDYWYGHGKKFYTVWVPMIGLNKNSSFEMVKSNKENKKIYSLINKKKSLLEKINKINIETFCVLPKSNQAAIFSSKLLHKSTNNLSKNLRISFDFRFGQKNDKSSYKKLQSWYKFQNKKLVSESNIKKKNFLKYIIDGRKIETSIQHLLIENFAKMYGYEISAQEAEIERFGYPMLKMHCKNIANKNKRRFKGIIIASETLLDSVILDEIGKYKTPIFACLEAKWL